MQLKKLVHFMRINRRWHKISGLLLSLFVLVSALTGILLSLKKESTWIQPETRKGISSDLQDWISLDSIAALAMQRWNQSFPQLPNSIDRLDVRPSKGIVKVLFKSGWWEVQVDGTTGQTFLPARRHSDWIEQLHDGSLVAEWFKLASMNLLGFGLLFMLGSGWWLWYGPKKIRRQKHIEKSPNNGTKFGH